MAHTKHTARRTGKPVKGKSAKFPKRKGGDATPQPLTSCGGKGGGKVPKKLITKTLKVGRAYCKNSGDKCRVMKKVSTGTDQAQRL